MNAFGIRPVCYAVLACALACASGAFAENEAPSREPVARESLPAEAPPLEAGRLTLGGRAGDGYQGCFLEAMIPVWKPGKAMLSVQPRGTVGSDDDEALSGGLVGRYLLPEREVILGANAFYDQSWTEAENTFGQVGCGVEALSKWVDMRVNYYYPVTDEERIAENERVDVSRSGRRTVTTTTLTQTYEEPMQGVDAELGAWLPYVSRLAPTAVFVGYYDFSGDVSDEDAEGFKVRAEVRVHPNITLDGEWFEEREPGKPEYLVGVRLHAPLDFQRGLNLGRRGGSGPRTRPFASRMLDPVYRRFEVMTREADRSSASARESIAARQVAAGPTPTQYSYLDSEGNVVIVTVYP